jgi:hypothetical protein
VDGDDPAADRCAGVACDRLHRHAEGFPSLALQVREILHRDPLSGHLFCFRGRAWNAAASCGRARPTAQSRFRRRNSVTCCPASIGDTRRTPPIVKRRVIDVFLVRDTLMDEWSDSAVFLALVHDYSGYREVALSALQRY